MRLFPSALVPFAATAALLVPSGAARAAAPDCAAADPRSFPLTTRIHGGPDTYEAGGGYGTWYLDLTNTTRRTCTDVHPVVVLVDRERELRASQPHLEFYEGDRARPVRFEATDEDELVGAFGGSGFRVGPGKTVTVKVRLALTSDAVANTVTVNAAVVQKQDDDGDWVGQSDDYRFDVEAGPGPGAASEPAPDPDAPPGTGDARTSDAQELAATGLTVPVRSLGAAIAVLLLVGAASRLVRGRR